MKKVLFLVFAFTAISTIAFSAPSLTIAQLTHIAMQNNNDLKAAQYNIALAKARLLQAGLWPNPSLNLMNTDDNLLTNEGEYTRSAGFSQAFPISGRIGQQKKIARVDVAIAMAEVKNAKRQLKGAVADSYYALLITDYRLTQLKNRLSINKKLMTVTQKRFQAAEVSEIDTNTAKLEYQRILQEKQILDSIRISQVAQLNQLLGRDASAPLLLKKSLAYLRPLPPLLSEVQTLAIKQRPDMQMLWLSLHRAQANQQLACSERWADWTVGLAYQQNKQVVQGAPPQNPDRALSISVVIPFPLLNANQGKVLEAGFAGTQALTKMQALKLAIQTEVASSYTQLQALQGALQLSRVGTLKLTIRNVKLARSAYKIGQISLLEVIQLQRQQNDLRVAYFNMLEKYLQALVKFCMAVGYESSLCPYLSDKRNLHAFSRHAKG